MIAETEHLMDERNTIQQSALCMCIHTCLHVAQTRDLLNKYDSYIHDIAQLSMETLPATGGDSDANCAAHVADWHWQHWPNIIRAADLTRSREDMCPQGILQLLASSGCDTEADWAS